MVCLMGCVCFDSSFLLQQRQYLSGCGCASLCATLCYPVTMCVAMCVCEDQGSCLFPNTDHVSVCTVLSCSHVTSLTNSACHG